MYREYIRGIRLAAARKTYPAHRREVGGQRRGHVHRPSGPREARGQYPHPRAGQASRHPSSSRRREARPRDYAECHAACGSSRTCRPLPPRTLPACPDAECPLPEDRPRARRLPRPCVCPLQFSPFGNPLSRFPLFSAESHQRGQTAGGKRTAAFMENGAKPPRSRRFFSTPFSAAALRVSPPRRRLINTPNPRNLAGAGSGRDRLRWFTSSHGRGLPWTTRSAWTNSPPKTLRGGLLLHSQQPPKPAAPGFVFALRATPGQARQPSRQS